jgi:hypothetical protein
LRQKAADIGGDQQQGLSANGRFHLPKPLGIRGDLGTMMALAIGAHEFDSHTIASYGGYEPVCQLSCVSKKELSPEGHYAQPEA